MISIGSKYERRYREKRRQDSSECHHIARKTIHEDGFVGTGSMVTKDVEKGHVVVGNPGRIIKKV